MIRLGTQLSSFGQKFGDLVREKRGNEGLTQEALAHLAFGPDARKALVSDIENGKSTNPRQSTVDALAVALNISREDIAARRQGADPRPAPTSKPDAPAISNLPDVKTRFFHGRDQYLTELRAALEVGDAAITQTIQGLGGVGKTTLAIHYARLPEIAARFPIRWWVPAEARDGMEKGLGDLGRRVGVVPDQTPDAKAAKQTLGWLREAPREALILFDNVEDGPLLAEFLPGDTAAALVTTRVRGMGGLAQVSLNCWQPETARDFLLERTGSDDAKAALALAGALGGLPLACEQAGAYCAEAGETLAGYLTRFQASPAKMMSKKAQGSAQEDTVAKTFALAIDRAAADCAGARAMLSVMAELAPEPMPLAVFGHDRTPEGLRDAEDASDAADALVRWALVERVSVRDALRKADTFCVSAHRLVRLAATDMQAGVGFELAARALGGAFPTDPDINVEGWPLCGALLPHASSILARITEFSTDFGDPKNFTLALNAAALFCDYALGDYALARSMFEAALKIDEAALGPDHPEVAIRLSSLAPVLLDLGGGENLKAARAALERALKIDEAAHGPDHPNVAIDLSNLSNVLRDLGGEENLKAARAALERALKIDEAAHGPDHPKVATRLSNLANVLRNLGGEENLKAARAALERALKIDEAAHGPDHPKVATRLSNLANVLRNLGGEENLKAARAALERALKIDEAALGPDHPNVGIRHVNMAPLLDQLGDRAGALRHAERALAIFTASLGAEHGHTQSAAEWVKGLGG